MNKRALYAIEKIRKAKINKEKSLDISQCGLKEFPTEVLELDQLEELKIGGFDGRFEHEYIGESGFYNEISEIPAEIYMLKNLRFIDLTLCPNLKLHPNFGQLGKLEILNLTSCGLNEIPECVFRLSNLKVLNLYSIKDADLLAFHKGYSYEDYSDNYHVLNGDLYFEELLAHWGNGEKFRNKISIISPQILKLERLETLNLNGNQIKKYPEFIDYHPSLREVSMFENQLLFHPINDDRKFTLTYNLVSTQKNIEKSFEDRLLERFEVLINSTVNPKIKKSLENSKIFFLRQEYSDSLKIIYPIVEEFANRILASHNEDVSDRSKYKGLFDKVSKLGRLNVIPEELIEFMPLNKPRNRILHGSYDVQNEQFLYPTALASLVVATELMEKLP
jgi:hypothetical protein